MALKKADRSATKRFERDGDWLVLRTVITKGEANHITQSTQYALADGDDDQVEMRSRFRTYRRELFTILAAGWSLAPGKPTVEDYEDLDEESGEWVDKCIDSILRDRREQAELRAEGKPGGSSTPASTPEPAPVAAEPA